MPSLTCPDFQTTPAFLEIHRRQRDETRTLIATAETDGRFRLAANHRQVHDNLDQLISALETIGRHAMTTDSTALVAAAQQRSRDTRRRAVDALRRIDAAGETITFTGVAQTAGVSRSWLYRQPDLRDEIDRLRTTRPTTAAGVPAAQRQPPPTPFAGASKPPTTRSNASPRRTATSANK